VEEVDASIQQPAGTTVAASVPPASVFKQPVETPKPVAAIPVSEKTSVPANVAQNDIPKPNSEPKSVPANQAPVESKPVVRERVAAPNIVTSENTEKPAEKNDNAPVAENASKTEKSNEPIQVGSLVDAATRKVNPTYPTVARTARVSGIVKVEVVLDEEGSVAEVKNAAGPEMLKRAATEAVRRWKFKPFMRDGQPVRASGFVNFNFTL
jgi:protein TonB